MKIKMKIILLLFVSAFLALTLNVNAQKFSYNFTSGYEGWAGDFADYPVMDSVFYELEFIRTTLPDPLNTGKYALKITGKNHSDDLFMFIKRKISGLLPNTTYRLLIDIEFASNAPTNAMGVGGPPGEGVTLKAGATIDEPLKVDSSGFYLMNINKGNQSQPGTDMDTIGHVGVSDTTTAFTLIKRNNSTHLFSITTDANGEVWVCIGTDSGFESTTTLYYNQIDLTFMIALEIDELPLSKEISLFPNPASELITILISPIFLGQAYRIMDLTGRQLITGKLMSEISNIVVSELTDGMYFIQIGEHQQHTFKFMKK
jgi:hypothetical protein